MVLNYSVPFRTAGGVTQMYGVLIKIDKHKVDNIYVLY